MIGGHKMYQKIGQVDAIQQIDSIIEQSKIREVPKVQNELTTTLSNHNKSEKEIVAKEELKRVTAEANEALAAINTQLVFKIHEGTGRPLIKLVEAATQEVIREIPSEKMLDVVAGIWEWAGLIVDRKE